jgi:small subunit ribosomal protein S2
VQRYQMQEAHSQQIAEGSLQEGATKQMIGLHKSERALNSSEHLQHTFKPRPKSSSRGRCRHKERKEGLATKKEQTSTTVTVKELLEAGVHFGHQTQRWNPKMKRFIFGERNGVHILDLAKTLKQLENALTIVKDLVAHHRSILFVGTKKAAKVIVRDCAERCGEFYVSERWLGGTLTNLSTIRQSIKKLDKIEKRIATGGDGLTKKEISILTKTQLKLEKNLSGVRGMRKVPGLLIIVDTMKEDIAVLEAKKLKIPIMALVDTNCNPDVIDYIIPANDDAQRSIKLILETLAQAIIDKKNELELFEEKDKDEEAKTSEEGEDEEALNPEEKKE